MDTRSSSEKKRFIGLMLSGGRSPNTAICALDHFKGQGRLFLVESFVGKKERVTPDLDDMLVERLQSLIQDAQDTQRDTQDEQLTHGDVRGTAASVEIITNAPLSLPPCFKCEVYRCPGKDQCEVPETVRIMELYDELKHKRKNLKKFTPYTQRVQDVWIRDAVPEVMPPHEAMGSNVAQITSRLIHLRKMMPGAVFKETYPAAGMFRLLPSLGLSSSYAKDYRDIVSGKRIRSTFIKKLEDKASVFIYDNDRDTLIESVQLFDSLILAFTGVLGFLGKTQGPPAVTREMHGIDYIIPVDDIKF
jgi:hypothetical protein